jgi:hypothetical protein
VWLEACGGNDPNQGGEFVGVERPRHFERESTWKHDPVGDNFRRRQGYFNFLKMCGLRVRASIGRGSFFQMPAKATGCNAVLARENGFRETADAEGFNEFLDLGGTTAGTRDGNLHTESYLPEQTAVDGLGRTDTVY